MKGISKAHRQQIAKLARERDPKGALNELIAKNERERAKPKPQAFTRRGLFQDVVVIYPKRPPKKEREILYK